ncbi:MAG: cation diffusion facilitator family transporter [Candidatus Dormibacteraeota bacterium]|nr:cation diffusion facilitator family transporter [Candidatus Dormibacteraeota bacterium]
MTGAPRFRNRGDAISRLEGFSDCAFGFAVTLLVVSLAVPAHFDQLVELIRGVPAFAVTFAIVASIWYSQFTFFRRYGLEDVATVVLNLALLFVVLVYVYPLKFLFGLTLAPDISGVITEAQLPQLFTIYGLGFAGVSLVLAAMYVNALRQRGRLVLTAWEQLQTRLSIYDQATMAGVGLFSALIAHLLPLGWVGFGAGFAYFLISVPKTVIGLYRRRRLQSWPVTAQVAGPAIAPAAVWTTEGGTGLTRAAVAGAATPARVTAPRVAGASLVVDCLLVLAKLVVGLLTGSLGLLSDAAHSGFDGVASLLALLAVRAARKPADQDHPFGHGRTENLAALAEGALLLVVAAVIGYAGLRRLLETPVAVDATPYAIALPALTIALELGRATILGWAAKRFRSPALQAGAQNRRSDIVASAGVLLGLLGVRAGLSWADAAAALLVAAIILRSAVALLWRSSDILIDRAPRGVEETLRRSIAAVEGVREVRQVRVRRSGGRLLADARVSARPTLSVEGAQQLSESVRAAASAAEPEVDLTLVVESQPDETNLVERVHARASHLGLIRDLHNVTVEREEDGGLHLSMHAKLPGSMTLDAAGQASAALERELRAEFEHVDRVDVHLEPLEPAEVRGADVTGSRRGVTDRVSWAARAHPAVLGTPDVELSDRDHHLVAHIAAQISGAVSLEEAHRVETEIEERARQAVPELSEVVARVKA